MTNNQSNLVVETNDMRGGFYLVTVRDSGTHEVLMFGSYHGGTKGELLIPPGATFDTELLTEIISALTEAYPGTNWTLMREKQKEMEM